MRTVKILSRHPTHNILRKRIPTSRPIVYRLGSQTEVNGNYIEINTIQSIKNSSNKLLMKQCFQDNDVITARWFVYKNDALYEKTKEGEVVINNIDDILPILAKKIYGSRGNGMVKIDTIDEFEQFINTNPKNYYYEKFHNYNKEYRLHVTTEGCFYTCRKVRKSTEKDKYYFNSKNCNWLIRENANFEEPSNFKEVKNECIKALNAVGLDIGAIDLRIQNERKSGSPPKFIVVEINSAPSFGTLTSQHYVEQINLIIKKICAD